MHSGQQSGPLYQDESGLTLMHARFGSESMTPIHNHHSWAIVGVYRGRDLYQKWRRSDAGNGAGDAQVALIEERVLEPGDVVIVPAPPQDIHAQQGWAGEAAYELVLFGTNPAGKPRLYLANSQVQGSEWGVEHHCQQYGAYLLSLAGPKATIPPKVVSTLSSFLCNKPYAYVLRGLSLQGEKRALSSRALQ
jgi:hypothetical protein